MGGDAGAETYGADGGGRLEEYARESERLAVGEHDASDEDERAVRDDGGEGRVGAVGWDDAPEECDLSADAEFGDDKAPHGRDGCGLDTAAGTRR